MHWFYILRCADSSLYIGETTDLELLAITQLPSAELRAGPVKARRPRHVARARAERSDEP